MRFFMYIHSCSYWYRMRIFSWYCKINKFLNETVCGHMLFAVSFYFSILKVYWACWLYNNACKIMYILESIGESSICFIVYMHLLLSNIHSELNLQYITCTELATCIL